MKTRKTISVEWLKDTINKRLIHPLYSQDQKQALATLLEQTLFETGNYRGFNQIHWMSGGHAEWEAAGKPENKDPYIYGGSREEHEWDRVYF